MPEAETTTSEYHNLVNEYFPDQLKAAQIYEKFVCVEVTVAKGGEEVITKIGYSEETRNVAKPGDLIVTNPGREKYIPPKEKFLKRHVKVIKMATEDDLDGVWRAFGLIRALKNPWNKSITILAPWGGPMNGAEDCWIATPVDVDGNVQDSNDMYIIAPKEFEETYRAKE